MTSAVHICLEGSIQLLAKKTDREIQLEEGLILAQRGAGVGKSNTIVEIVN